MIEALDGPLKGVPPTPEQIAPPLVDVLIARHVSLRGSVFVALGGRSGAGKSTIADVIAQACRSRGVTVTVIGGARLGL